MNLLALTLGADREVVWVAKGNRVPHKRDELGEANREDRTSGRRAHRIPPERDEIIN
jgi:hypothetical protein